MARPFRLIAGLGNPGREYAKTRHNAGAWYVHDLAGSTAASFRSESRFQGMVAKAATQAGDVRFLLPQTFMNLSGTSVAALALFYRVPPEEILVAHDELDLKPGVVKLKYGGGTAGHNGLKDIAAKLGTKAFWRLRIGVGHPRDSSLSEQEVVDYVLHPPRAEEQVAIDDAVRRAIAVWPQLAAGDTERAMHELHTTSSQAGVVSNDSLGRPA